MTKQLFFLLCLLYCFSCASQKKEVIAKSTIKLEGKKTDIRDLININGYYCESNPNISKTVNVYNMFFEDGTYVNFSFKEGLSDKEISQNMYKSVYKWTENTQDYWGTYWGAYQIKGDTIITYYYCEGSFWTSWILQEIQYKVTNKTTIIPIYSKSLLKVDEQYYNNTDKSPWIENGTPLLFHPADSLPPSDCWLKEEKWIWRNEADWKTYMNEIKQKKNKK